MVKQIEPNEIETRERILDAAEELFANQGYKGASLKAIAAAAGVTGAMINYYFGNKNNLYHAVLDRILQDIGKMVQDVLATGRPAVERLEIFYGWFFDYAAQHPNFSKLTKMGLGGPEKQYFKEIIGQFFNPMFLIGVGFFENELPKKTKNGLDTKHLLLSIYGMTTAYFSEEEFMSMLLGKNALGESELAKRKECLLEIIYRALGLERPDLKGKSDSDKP